MNAQNERIPSLLLACVLAAAAPLAARDARDAGDAPAPAGDAPAPAGDPMDMTDDEIDAILENLTPEQIEGLIKTALTRRLEVERKQVIAEIREGLLYEKKDSDAAIRIVEDKPAGTKEDNIDRICRAFARVDLRFRKLYDPCKAKKYKEAVAVGKRIVNPRQATYLSAAQHYLYARALAGAGDEWEAVETYRAILENMPERISFASAAALNAAEMYERMNRFLYAMEMYAYCIKNYGLTIDKATADRLVEKIDEYTKTYKDPLGTLAKKMETVRSRLAAIDSGTETQKEEEQIVAILDDLIQTAEEQQQQQQQQQQRQRQKRQGQKPGQKPGQKQGQKQAQGSQGGQRPTKPMRDSRLVPGAVRRPGALSKIHDDAKDGDWAKLSPRQQEQLQARLKKIISERYRDIIKDYHSRLADDDSR